MSYFPITEEERNEMLKGIGVDSFSDLISSIPDAIRNPHLDLPDSLSEIELSERMRSLSEKNTGSRLISFCGAGAYEHFIPASVRYVCSRTEFYTAYTPYQAECAQGILQSIYEYQSMICELTGMDVATASHYDGATALAESVIMSAGMKRRKKVVVSAFLHPDYMQVLQTYLRGSDIEAIVVGSPEKGVITGDDVSGVDFSEVACFVVQTPNFNGLIESSDHFSVLRDEKVHLIMVADPLSFACLRSGAEFGADVVVGDAQVFGNSLSFGGPHLGYIAATKGFMRKLPGRLVGATVDTEGRRSFVLTLQAREQHIRREKATSNICSNQALCALAACVYLAAVGRQGLKKIWRMNFHKAHYLKNRLSEIDGVTVSFAKPFFNEFSVDLNCNARDFRRKMISRGFDPGVPVSQIQTGASDNRMLICATETKRRDDLDNYLQAFSETLKEM